VKNYYFPLSVILLTHNQSDILKMQVLALECQEGIKNSEFEVIVTDDSSNPEEVLKIEKVLSGTSLVNRLLRQSSDRFWAARARNEAISVAKGELLLFFDGDMIPEIDVLSKHLAMQRNKSKHILAGHRLRRRIQPQGNDLDKVFDSCRDTNLSDPTIARWQLDEEKKREEFLLSSHPWRVVFSCHMSVCAASEVKFDESFKGWGPEDWELSYRLVHHHGYTVGFAPNIKAYEVDHLGQGVGNVFRLRTKQSIIDYLRNTFYFFDQCPGLKEEDVFWGLQKLELQNEEWVITPSKKDCNLGQRIAEARRWLRDRGHYDHQ